MRLKRLDFVYYWISSSYNDSNDSLCSFVSWIFLILLQFESSWYFCLPFFPSLLVFFGNFRISDVGNFDFFFRCDGRKEKIYIERERERKESEEMAPTRRRWRDRLPPVFSTTYIIDIRQPLVLVQCSPPPSPLIGITYTNLPVPSFRKFLTTVSYGRLYLEQCSWQMINEKINIFDNPSIYFHFL